MVLARFTVSPIHGKLRTMRILVLALAFAVIPPSPVVSTNPAINGEINDKSVGPVVALFEQATKDHTKEVVLEIDSPGGYNDAGFQLIDAMQKAQKAGVRIVCIANHAYSMAAIVFEGACTQRHLKKNGELIFHEAAFFMLLPGGSRLTKTALRELADDLQADDNRAAELIAPHMGMTPKAYLDWIAGEDRSISPLEAMVKGFVDELTP
jgi:ATP-dependent protease ClpP protease subunit